MPQPEKPPVKYWCQLPETRKASARDALRIIAKQQSFKTDDGMANVALEALWNAMHFDYEPSK